MQIYIDKIKAEEGDKKFPYKCPAGKWTIGAGIKVSADVHPICANNAMVGGLRLLEFGMPLNVRDWWLSIIVEDLLVKVNNRLYDELSLSLDRLPKTARIVLIDMAYQMGVNGLFKFENMMNCLADVHEGPHYWEHMAKHLLDSSYARQTPNRALRNAELLRGLAL
jgi:hypothetical protein